MKAQKRSAVRLCIAAVGLVALAACEGSGGGGSTGTLTTEPPSSSAAPAAPTVTMTIADHAKLTGAVPWQVKVTTTSDDDAVVEVDFIIDGKQQWREQAPPYFFDDDHQVLPPWLLGKGLHELTAHVVMVSGATADVTASVNVRTDVSKNKLVAGKYHRTVTTADQQRVMSYRTPNRGAFGEVTPTGRWTLWIKPNGEIFGRDPLGNESIPFVTPFTLSGSTARLYGAAIWRQPDPSTPSKFCEPEGASDYTWSLSGSSLTIRNKQNVCADRDIVFVGTWTRR
jgi:hypothetical protein